MRLRLSGFSLPVVLCTLVPALAQQPTEPATLGNLTDSDAAHETADTPDDMAPKPPAGTVVRPRDGVQHPDLDKAWADYDSMVTKAATALREAMIAQRQEAREAGDLPAAKRYRDMLEDFDKKGALPRDDRSLTKQVAAAQEAFQTAAGNLQKTYKAVVVALVKDTTIDESEAVSVEDERNGLASGIAQSPQTKGGDILVASQLPRDAISGHWERVANGIVVRNDGNSVGSRLCFPVDVPREYEVTISFTRNWGNNGFGLFATHGKTAFLVQLSVKDGQWAVLNEVQGGPPCKVPSPYLGNTQHQLVVTVRNGGVTARCDGRLLFKQATDYSTIAPDRYGFGANRLGLISWYNDVTFHNVELRAISR